MSSLLLSVTSLLVIICIANGAVDTINDFRVVIQACGGGLDACFIRKGAKRSTSYMTEGGNWTSWSGDYYYGDLSGFRIGLIGSTRSIHSREFPEDMDIRLCVQIARSIQDENDDPVDPGNIECTSWITEGGGWSNYSTCGGIGWDAWRVLLDTRNCSGLLLSNVSAGVRVTNSDQEGTAQFTDHLQSAQNASWSGWALEDTYEPVGVRVYIAANVLTTDSTAKPTTMSTTHPSMNQSTVVVPSSYPSAGPSQSVSGASTAKPTSQSTETMSTTLREMILSEWIIPHNDHTHDWDWDFPDADTNDGINDDIETTRDVNVDENPSKLEF